ncbi:M20/M25/M40 family metallo-hydrolase [Marinovum sp. 2_MG-2023]|uniref:M20 family metallopeptidase n=1 Tax=unclassified Marinovum TaxID=2647166 RepID=UPI0026E3B870|nr:MULTISPECIES: M20/M25/M40 family metallo-hydrolase [unclassified Marinovum]MDO6730929.1 M20/M25/M40 family metallo-hydrolase [Marinovum sp. 2_MG-2023]MDO6780156.1 M20/M25/M40 family metallo-hydrolase [Marinovum sp. 1_MG-2023]
MSDSDLKSRLVAAQDGAADVALLQRAIGCESVTGHEAGFASFLSGVMAELDLNPGSGDFLAGRPNTWGARAGAGPNLMFVGHTDTVHVRGWAENWQGQPQEDPFAAPVIAGEVWGRGACDLKAGICASLAALRLLDMAGVTLAGTVSFAFIGDEESGEPGTGVSAGAKDLVQRVAAGEIAKPDFAVYVEPTKLEVYTAQIGFFIADIKVTGKSAYFGTPEDGVDALKATHAILSAIWAHGAELTAAGAHPLVGPSDILVTEIKGGGYIAVPGDCGLSLIRKLRPGETLDDAVAGFEAAVKAAPVSEGIRIDISYPAGRDHVFGGSPVEIDPDHPGARALADCVAEVRGTPTPMSGAPYWSEAPFLVNEIGCPAIYCAPGDISVAHTFHERVNVDEYLAAIRAFALFMVRYCGTQETIPTGESK